MVSENIFLFHACIMGIYITFVYDILRILRRVIPHNNFWVSVEDIVFWIYCAAEVFLLMHHESDGTLRWFAIMGALAGMLVYRKTIGCVLVKYVSLVLQKLLMFLGKIVYTLATPFIKAGKGAAGVANTAKRSFKTRVRRMGLRAKKKLTFFLKILKMNL